MLLLQQVDRYSLHRMLDLYGLQLTLVAPQEVIPGSYWGEREAGLIGDRIFARMDTPVHSLLHEFAHFVCMTPERRASLDTDAKGDDIEEAAVCYLQILMAEHLSHASREQMFRDMDEWGYSFRLGRTSAWFNSDAGDARAWLAAARIIDEAGQLTHQCRG